MSEFSMSIHECIPGDWSNAPHFVVKSDEEQNDQPLNWSFEQQTPEWIELDD